MIHKLPKAAKNLHPGLNASGSEVGTDFCDIESSLGADGRASLASSLAETPVSLGAGILVNAARSVVGRSVLIAVKSLPSSCRRPTN
jgi:hypothetical protein